MVCYYFPPLGGIGSLRALKFASYLPELGWLPTVLTPRNGAYYRDETLSFPERQVVRTASLELSRAGKRTLGLGRDDTASASVGGVMRTARDLVRRWVYRPDAQIGWYPFAVAAGRKALRRERYDLVFSSSFPITAHLAARRLARDFALPWVGEFRDVWTDAAEYDSAARRRSDQRTERALLRDADAVVTVSPTWANLMRERGAARVEVITNGFDPTDFPDPLPPVGDTASHLGTYYPGRQDLGTALRALGEWRRTGALPNLRLRFIGSSVPATLRPILDECGLSGSTEVTGFLPYRESLRAVCQSRLLLLAGPAPEAAREAVERGWIAAKVFEYLGSGRPILYVGDPRADVARLLASLPGVAFARPGDVHNAVRAAAELLQRAEAREPTELESFTRRSLTARLAGLFDEVART
jgi:glycosyltransferase involved in cell wall biosynthesis